MGRHLLSKSDIRRLNGELARFGVELSKKDTVELDDKEGRSYTVNGALAFFEKDGQLLPHLKLLLDKPSTLKRVTVDKGAVKFVANGADVMRPGIVAIEDGIAEGQVVAVVEETHGKPLAIGTALLATEAMRAAPGGKAVKTLHWVGDKAWTQG